MLPVIVMLIAFPLLPLARFTELNEFSESHLEKTQMPSFSHGVVA